MNAENPANELSVLTSTGAEENAIKYVATVKCLLRRRFPDVDINSKCHATLDRRSIFVKKNVAVYWIVDTNVSHTAVKHAPPFVRFLSSINGHAGIQKKYFVTRERQPCALSLVMQHCSVSTFAAARVELAFKVVFINSVEMSALDLLFVDIHVSLTVTTVRHV